MRVARDAPTGIDQVTRGSGFYGLIDPSGCIRREAIPGEPFPQPQSAQPPLIAAAWSTTGEAAGWHCEVRLGLAFQGEFYNLTALRKELGTADALPIAQVLLLAHRRWPLDFIHHLEGQFVLALWDGDLLHLYRDTSGAHQLYYSLQSPDRIAFATRLDALFRLPGVERRLDRRALYEYLRLLEIAAPNSLFEGIHALPAGQLFSWSAAGIARTHPGSKQPAQRDILSFEAALERLDGLLRESIARRLEDTQRPAAFLSGGVDSSLLCALASHIRSDITAVTVGFDTAGLDETPVARRVARHLGLRHEVLRFGRQDFVRAFETFAHGAEQPMADPALPPTLLAFGHCARHYDAVLDGSGADEAFGLLPPRHVRLAVEYAALLPRRLRGLLANTLKRLPGLAGYAPIFDFEHPAETMLRWRGFPRAEIEALCGEPVDFEHTLFYRTFARFPRQAHFERYSALLDAMTCDRLHHAASITGLTVRYPYWDAGVDGFVRALPVGYRYALGEPKRLLRQLLARHVPRELWDVSKHGFEFPLLEFLHAEDFALVRRYLHREPWQRWGLLAPAGVEGYARRFMSGDRGVTFRVWALVVLAAWLEAHPV